MKHLVLIFLAFSMSVLSFSQDKIEEAVLTSKQSLTSDNEQMNAQLAMVGDMTATVYVKGENSRSELSSPMTGDVVTIIDGSQKKMLMLVDNPMSGKIYSLQSFDESSSKKMDLSVTKGNETKTILGYECQLYNVTYKLQGQEVKMEMYVTDAIEAANQEMADFGDKIEGFPLFMKINMNQMGANMTIINEVTKIEEKSVPKEKFDMTIPEGYKEIPQQ